MMRVVTALQSLSVCGQNRPLICGLKPATADQERVCFWDSPSLTHKLTRFEVALIGNARLAVKRFGQHSGSFDKKWIEVTGTCRYLEEGDVTVCQLPITEIDMIQIHDNDWQQYESQSNLTKAYLRRFVLSCKRDKH